MNNINKDINLPAEWVAQDAILIAWPHAATDWDYILEETVACYKQIARHILDCEDLIVVTPNVEQAKADMAGIMAHAPHQVHFYCIDTNDTWARDFGPVTVSVDGHTTAIDFKFNAWGMKYAADKDNQIVRQLDAHHIFNQPVVDCHDFVLEGGSIESDGNGTLMTTTSCLLACNRNEKMQLPDIEQYLKATLGAKHIIWLKHGMVAGDDTDGHIDTLARFAPGNVIVYNGTGDQHDAQARSLDEMKKELAAARNSEGQPYRLVELPLPRPIYDEKGCRLPATYANFLVTNGQVLVPTYNQEDIDAKALETLQQAFPGRTATGIDCTSLIKQHGSLHCVTMQIPHNTLKL